MFGTKKALPSVGDSIVVIGAAISSFVAKVDRVVYMPDEDRTRIDLDWGQYGHSRVWADDEGKVWTRIEAFN
jgi:hypothetical protein